MASLTPESRNMVNLQQSYFMNGNECSGICLFKVIIYKSQVCSRSTITLLLRNLTTGVPDLIASFENNISAFNKYISYSVTAVCARGEDPGNLLTQLFATYADCSLYIGTFTRYIKILEISTTMKH